MYLIGKIFSPSHFIRPVNKRLYGSGYHPVCNVIQQNTRLHVALHTLKISQKFVHIKNPQYAFSQSGPCLPKQTSPLLPTLKPPWRPSYRRIPLSTKPIHFTLKTNQKIKKDFGLEKDRNRSITRCRVCSDGHRGILRQGFDTTLQNFGNNPREILWVPLPPFF
jgi:hypothetical protein